jgi:hypothetical protein
MLPVRVALHGNVVAVAPRVFEPGLDGAPDAQVEREPHQPHAVASPHERARGVRRTVVDYEQVVIGHLLPQRVEHPRNALFLVVRRDDDKHAQRHAAAFLRMRKV